jgi:hypothetical protein
MRHVKWRECWLGPKDLLCDIVTQIPQEFHGDTPGLVRQAVKAGNSLTPLPLLVHLRLRDFSF